jgi:hypothetical protein
LLLLFGAVAVLALYRGYEGSLAHGQLVLSQPTARLHSLVMALGGLALAWAAATPTPRTQTASGLAGGAVAPATLALWALLPLTAHLPTALLVLELVGVSLIWAIVSNPTTARVRGSAAGGLGLLNGVILFVWASGLSALALLMGLGLAGLSGHVAVVGAPSSLWGAFLAAVLSLKFLVGGGQFLLMAWYRYLPPEALTFYLSFYYPAHLLAGLGVLVGLSLPHLQAAAALVGVGLGVGLVSLVPHLGAQNSPALTLAGSSFVGLALVALALLAG